MGWFKGGFIEMLFIHFFFSQCVIFLIIALFRVEELTPMSCRLTDPVRLCYHLFI